MTLTAAQHQIAAFLDQAVSAYPDTEQGTEALLENMSEYMDAFKRLVEISTMPEINRLGARYPHFYRFAKRLELYLGLYRPHGLFFARNQGKPQLPVLVGGKPESEDDEHCHPNVELYPRVHDCSLPIARLREPRASFGYIS